MTNPLRRIGLPAIVAAILAGVVIALSATVAAQTPGETPVINPTGELVPTSTEGAPVTADATDAAPTEEPTPGPDVTTLVKITVDPAIQPIDEGDEFQAVVSVEGVEHLAGFEFAIAYDPDKVQPVLGSGQAQSAEGTPSASGNNVVRMTDMGQILLAGGRDQDSILCSDPRVVGSTAVLTCSILEAPVCAGGLPGVSGDGTLASVFFKAKGGGTTTLDVGKSTLVLDDVVPPCPENEEDDFQIQTIPHRREGAQIELKADEGSSLLLIGGIVAAVAALALVGGGGYYYYRQRQTPAG